MDQRPWALPIIIEVMLQLSAAPVSKIVKLSSLSPQGTREARKLVLATAIFQKYIASLFALWFRVLAYVRSGYVNVNDGKMYNVGQNGNDWSRTSLSSTHAYHLNFNPTGVNPSNNSNRWAGFSLRCFARAVPILNHL